MDKRTLDLLKEIKDGISAKEIIEMDKIKDRDRFVPVFVSTITINTDRNTYRVY